MIEMEKNWTEKESQKKLEAERALRQALSTAEEKCKTAWNSLFFAEMYRFLRYEECLISPDGSSPVQLIFLTKNFPISQEWVFI